MKTVRDALPPEILEGATRRGTEYGWELAAFPDALRRRRHWVMPAWADSSRLAGPMAVSAKCIG